MDEALYHMDHITACLRRLNPHMELRESVKNTGDFTLDLFLRLSGHETRVKIPMDMFRNYTPTGRKAVEELLGDGYAVLLRKLQKQDPQESPG
jgi:hypothetical protein